MSQHRSNTVNIDSDTSDHDNFDDSEGDSQEETDSNSEKDLQIQDMAPRGTGVQDYEKLFKAAQLSLMELKIELKNAKKENVVLAENQPRRRLKGVPKEISQHDKVIKDLGRQYAITICPWVDASSFGHKTRPDIDPMDPDRYKTKLTAHHANIAELFDFVPEELHTLMEKHSYFGDLFRSHVNAMRSTAAHGIRQQGSIIFNLNGNLIASGVDRASKPELQEYITVNGEYSSFPPILYPDSTMKKQDVFRNDFLPKILRVIFFGPSSLSPNSVPRPKTNAEIWKITGVTAGSIAFAAILARFLLSPDVEFSPKGSTTNIDYLGDFNLYKRMLMSSSNRMKSLFEWYDKRIFSRNSPKPPSNTPVNENAHENFDEMMRAIDQTDDDVPPPNDDADGMQIESSGAAGATVLGPSPEETSEDPLEEPPAERHGLRSRAKSARGKNRTVSGRRAAGVAN